MSVDRTKDKPTLPDLTLATGNDEALERTYWVVRPWLLAGAYPGHPEPAKHEARMLAIRAAGARTFVNLMEENARNNQGEPFVPYDAGADARCLRFSVVDGSIPSRALMRSILDAIDLSLEARRPVYVHCFGGMGRTATVVGCWLLRHALASRSDVLDVITRLRKADKLRASRDAPENAEQREFVLSWPEGKR